MADGDDVLRPGDSGDGVLKLQSALKALGYDVGSDGGFGPSTRRAVMAFQKKNKIRADGVAGPATIRAIARSGNNATPVDGRQPSRPPRPRRAWR